MKRSLLLSFAAICAFSQEIDLSTVSVIATGEEEEVVKQPLSVSVKEKEEIELDQVIFQKDLFNSLAGVRVEQTGSVFGHMTSIRMPINTGPYYLFTQDGIPLQSSGFFNHNGLAYGSFELASRAEVLKGAGTALYGSDAVAAVVNIQTLQAPTKQPFSQIAIRGGSDNYGSGVFEASTPLGSDSGIRANIGYTYSGGWRDHTSAYRMEGNLRYDKEIDDENYLKILVSTTKTRAQQADSFNDYQNILDGSTAASDDPKYFAALEKVDIKRKFDFARISMEWDNYRYEDLEIKVLPYLRYNRNRYIATWEPNLPSNDNELYTLGLITRGDLQKEWGRFIVGVDTEYTQSSLKYDQLFDATAYDYRTQTTYLYSAGAIYDYDVDYFAIAPYIHTEYNLAPKWKLTAGLRFDFNRFDYTNNLQDDSYYVAISVNDPTVTKQVYYRPADRSDDFSHFSPKLSLSYEPMKGMNFYLRYANGFRIPQASRLYSMKAGYITSSLDPEVSDTYEIGFKKVLDNAFIDMALYYMRIDNTITRYQNDNGDYYYANGNGSIHKGVELTLDYQMTQALEAKIAYSYSRHNYDNDPKYGDNEMAQAPNHTGNFRLFYRPLNGLELMGEYIYVGSWWIDDAHEAGKYKGYRLANFKAMYQMSKNLKFFAKVNNIADSKYAVMARYAYGKTDYTPGDPRQYYIGLEYRW